MKKKIALGIYRLILFVSLFSAFLLIFWGLQRCIKGNGTVNVTATNVEMVDNISASGIVAYLFDHYYFPANEVTFTEEIVFGYNSDYGSIQYQDSDGNWITAESLQVQPMQNSGKLTMTSLPGRVDYTIAMACLNAPEDPLSFPCSMKYHFVSESKFKYIMNAPYMEILVYFQDEEHTDEYDEFFLEFNFENCTVSHEGEEIAGPLRLFVWNKADSGFQGDIWSRTGFFIYSLSGRPCITDTFSGSATIEDVPYPDRFFFTYANEIIAKIDGNLFFRYGSNSTDYELFSEQVYLHLDSESLEEDKIAQSDYLHTYLNWDEDSAWFSHEVFEPNLKIESINLDNTQTTTFEISGTVDKAKINGISLFPNMKTFLVDNSMNIEIVGIIMAIVSFILPVPEKITFNLSSKKKGTRSDDDKNDNESVKDRIELHVEACHYAFFKFAASVDVSGTPLENMFGIKKLDANTIQDPYDLPMLRCEVTNNSHQEIRISEPIIQGEIEIHSNSYTEMGFQMIPSADKILKPGAKAEFYIHGPVIIFIIKAFLENKITAIYAEDNSGFKYHADLTAIDSIVAYFSKYCSDLAELRDRHDKFCI